MDRYLKKILWDPFKFAGKSFQFLNNKKGLYVLCIFFLLGFLLFAFDDHLPEQVDKYLHLLFAFIGTMLVFVA